jgi:hypothetical protein
VGGIAALVIIGVILFFFMRSRGRMVGPSPVYLESSQIQPQPYQPQPEHAGNYVPPGELLAASSGPYGSLAPTYVSTPPLHPDVKTGAVVYEAPPSSPKFPARPTYEVSAEK